MSISNSVHTSLVKYNSKVSTKASINERSESTFYTVSQNRFSYFFFFQISSEQVNQISYLFIHASVASMLEYVALAITSERHKYLVISSSHIHSRHFSFKSSSFFRVLESEVVSKSCLS